MAVSVVATLAVVSVEVIQVVVSVEVTLAAAVVSVVEILAAAAASTKVVSTKVEALAVTEDLNTRTFPVFDVLLM